MNAKHRSESKMEETRSIMRTIKMKSALISGFRLTLPLLVLIFIPAGLNAQSFTPEEQNCFNMVQGKVAYDRAGNNRWNEDNIRALCKGTANAAQTISCFSSKIAAGVLWNVASPACATATTAPTNTPLPNLNGDWAGYFASGAKSNYVWRIVQNGQALAFEDVGAGSRTKFTGRLAGNTITDSNNVTGTLRTNGRQINWSNGVVWIRQGSTAGNQINALQGDPALTPAAATPSAADTAAVEANIKNALYRAANVEIDEIDGPRKYAIGEGEISVGSHVNGMAKIGDWIIVNYPNFDGRNGRLLFWNMATGNWANVKTFSMGGYGFPAGMDADGHFLAVATGDSKRVKFFNFADPSNGVTELTELETAVGGSGENVGLAFDTASNKYLLYAQNKFYLSTGNVGRSLATANGWREIDSVSGDAIPFGEAGTPLRSLGGGLFALLSLGTDVHDVDSFTYKLSFITLNGTSSISSKLAGEYTFKKQGEGGGAPSFRWGGTAVLTGVGGKFGFDLYAAPKRLDASGNYYKWSSAGTIKLDYNFQIKTGTASGAGTDSNIYIKICGTNGCGTEQQVNSKISGDAFENGDLDKFSLSDIDVGNISYIEVRSGYDYAGAAWLPEWIKISYGSRIYEFALNVWFQDTGTKRFSPSKVW